MAFQQQPKLMTGIDSGITTNSLSCFLANSFSNSLVKTRSAVFVAAAVFSSVISAGDTSPAEQVAEDLIAEMAEAMKSLTYRGEFVHLMGTTVESMRILHAQNHKGEYERLTSLNGEAREVFRTDKLVTCVWPGSKSVIVGSSKERKSIPQIDATVLGSEYYRIEHDGFDRVASRDVHVVDITPQDRFRYGYKFWIDQESKMLLRMLLLDARGSIVEQMMFTSIEYPDTIDLENFEAMVNQTDYTFTNSSEADSGQLVFLREAGGSSSEVTKGTAASSRSVSFSTLPGGYFKVSETYNPMPIGNSPISHVTISDGMASVSVYVEYMSEDKHEQGTKGLSRMGAVNAYGTALQDALITVVGEVPAAVVQAIGDAVKLEGI